MFTEVLTADDSNISKKRTSDSNSASNSPSPAIFISTAQRNITYDTPKTGDIDYAHSIAKEINILQPNAAMIAEKLYIETEIYQHVLQKKAPILHVMLNPPFTGMAFTPEGLKNFRANGGRVVVTVIEFAKFEGREKEYQKNYDVHPQQCILQFIEQADEVIFLDENDKKNALTYFELFNQEKNKQSTVSLSLHISASPARARVALFETENAKHQAALIQLTAHLKQFGRFLGSAYSEGDCFFDAVSQQLGDLQSLLMPQVPLPEDRQKQLRMLCNHAAAEADKGNKEWVWVREWVEKDGGYKWQDYLAKIQYTALEMGETSAIWGRPYIEGRIICQALSIQLHSIEVMEADGNVIFNHQLINNKGVRNLSVEDLEQTYADPNMLHLVVYQGTLHFVPILKPVQTHSHSAPVLQQAKVIPVLPTIAPMSKPLAERGKDIISFGIIRQGKGLALVVELAREIKQRGIDKKVLVVGTVLDNRDGLYQLQRLMNMLYPSKSSEILTSTTVATLKAKLQVYKNDAGLSPELPLEIHTDVNEVDLPLLFNRCTYAFLPAYRGATLRNSSISSCIAQELIVYTHSEGITPASLLSGGAYENAIMIKPFDAYNNSDGASGRNYVLSVLEDILTRDKNVDLNKPNVLAMQKLMVEVLSRGTIAKQHLALYANLKAPAVTYSTLGVNDSTQGALPTKKPITLLSQYFNHWRAVMQASRAFRQFHKIHKIDMMSQAKANFRALHARIGKLSPEERQFLDTLLSGKWFLTHTTKAYPAIQKAGNTLLSLKERTRRSIATDNRNTNYFEGNDDNVFFAFGPGNIESPDFLKDAPHVISIDFDKALEQKSSNLTGLWFSSHVFAFFTEQDCLPMIIHGAKLSIFYRKINPKGPNIAENVRKTYRYEYKEGSPGEEVQTRVEETIGLEDEIFLVQDMKVALILMAIERVRKLGRVTWQAVMQETRLEYCQKIVQDMFHTGLFEVHKPAQFSLEGDYVTVEERPVVKKSQWQYPYDALKAAKDAIWKGDTDTFQEMVGKDPSLLTHSISTGTADTLSLSLLDIASIAGQSEIMRSLLSTGHPILLERNDPYVGYATMVKGSSIYSTLFTGVLLLASPKIQEWTGYPEAKQNIHLFRQYVQLLTEYGIAVSGKPYLRHPAIITVKDIQNAITLELPESEIEYLVTLAHVHPRHLPILLAAATGSLSLVQLMAKTGADINQQYQSEGITGISSDVYQKLKGLTPLLQAILIKNEDMAEALMSLPGIDINKAWKIASLTSAIGNLPYAGYTPLMLAVELGLETIAVKLLAMGATVFQVSALGENALDIARRKGSSLVAQLSVLSFPETNNSDAMTLQERTSLSPWEKRVLQHPHRLVRSGVVIYAKDSQNNVKLIRLDNKFVQSALVAHFPWHAKELFKNFIEVYPQISVLNENKLLECGFNNEQEGIYYGFQLHCLQLTSETLHFLQEQMPDYTSVCDLKQPNNASHKIPPLSEYEKLVWNHLKEEQGRLCIGPDGQGEVEEALKGFLRATSQLRQAIEAKDATGVRAFVAKYPDIDLEDFELPGEYPKGTKYQNKSAVLALPLAITAGSVEVVMAILNSGKTEGQSKYSYIEYIQDIAELLIQQDNIEAFLHFVTLDFVQKGFESVLSMLSQMFARQTVVTGKIANWFMQHHKEKLDLNIIFLTAMGSPIFSLKVALYWLSQSQKFPAVKVNVYPLWKFLEEKKERLNLEEKQQFLQLLDEALREDEAVYPSSFLPCLLVDPSFFEEVCLFVVRRLNADKRRGFADSFMAYVKDTVLTNLDSEQQNAVMNVASGLLATLAIVNSWWIYSAVEKLDVKLFSILMQYENYDATFSLSTSLRRLDGSEKVEDQNTLKEMFKIVIRVVSLKPGHRLIQPFMEEFREKRNLSYVFGKKFVELFDMAEQEEKLEQERVLKEREAASQLSTGTGLLLLSKAHGKVTPCAPTDMGTAMALGSSGSLNAELKFRFLSSKTQKESMLEDLTKNTVLIIAESAETPSNAPAASGGYRYQLVYRDSRGELKELSYSTERLVTSADLSPEDKADILALLDKAGDSLRSSLGQGF